MNKKISISNSAIQKNLRRIVNQIYKLLPCREESLDWQAPLTTIIEETFVGNGGFDLKNYINQINNISSDMPVIIEHLGSEDEYINAVKRIEFITKGKNENADHTETA